MRWLATLAYFAGLVLASAADNDGLTRTNTVNPLIAPTLSMLSFPAMLDTYVDEGSPTRSFGTAAVLKVDGSPVRQTLLRFNVTGVGAAVRSARLQLTASRTTATASDSGGMLHVIGGGWSEATTFATRPAITAPPLASRGSVEPGDVVDFDVSSVVRGNGTYNFAINSASHD